MQSKIRKMAECSMLVALATVLSVLKLVEMPYGGSITFASMLPIVIMSYRHGCGWGLISGLLYGVIQQLLGLNSLSYFTTWYSILAVILLDYVLAFTVLGFAGAFRKKAATQSHAMILGSLLACLLRYVLHTVAGCTVWAGLSIPTEAALIYSIGYNATYMLPETIILLITAAYLSSMLDFNRNIPTRVHMESGSRAGLVCQALSGLAAVAGITVATVLIFPHMQDAETGDFILHGLSSVNWTATIIALGAGVISSLALYLVARKINRAG
ncbi:MAG: energy-coupled thiamine transporter ThiT [Clostridia bacterium]|nr:energy-coupled thiamine transporter ThiT [Clostridia bacterium]